MSPVAFAHPAGYEGRFDVAGWYLVRSVVRLKRSLGARTPSLIDLGMGRGRDLIYLGRRGFRVLGVDLASAALDQAQRRAQRLGTTIRTQRADLRTYRLRGTYNVVFSSSALNHLPPRIRRGRFEQFKGATRSRGIHAINAFVPNIPRARTPDMDAGAMPFRSGELAGYYDDWSILDSRRFELRCGFGGVSHRHAWDVVIARKPD
jgi:SAM-dependent methyltransferase